MDFYVVFHAFDVRNIGQIDFKMAIIGIDEEKIGRRGLPKKNRDKLLSIVDVFIENNVNRITKTQFLQINIRQFLFFGLNPF